MEGISDVGYEETENCVLCPHRCGVNRNAGQTGFCGQTSQISLARAALHYWEEPCISGNRGSGAIFFCGCNLRCIFCQNSELSNSSVGRIVSAERLSEIMLELQEQGAHNINLVTPGHFIPQIVRSLELAKKRGLSIPIVYNTGSYEYESSIKLLDGLVDIYMPDLKYMDGDLSRRLSGAADYFERASGAIDEMFRQVGACRFADTDGEPADAYSDGSIMQQGVLIRHLVLPGHTRDSKAVMDHIHKAYGSSVYVSIMNQYTPMPCACDRLSEAGLTELTRTLTHREYDRVVDHCLEIGMENAFIQEGPTCKESFIPNWDYTGV